MAVNGAASPLEAIAAFVSSVRSSAQHFVSPPPEFLQLLRVGVKGLYDTSAAQHFGTGYSSLPSLPLDAVWDAEALWGMIAHGHAGAIREIKREMLRLKKRLQQEAAAQKAAGRAGRGKRGEAESDDEEADAPAAGHARAQKQKQSRRRAEAEEDEDETSDSDAGARRRASSVASNGDSAVDASDMEAFLDEGDAYMEHMLALKEGKAAEDDEDEDDEDDEEGSEADSGSGGGRRKNKGRPVSFADVDMNAPIPDAGADDASLSKEERIRRLLASAPRYKDFFDDDAASGEAGSDDDERKGEDEDDDADDVADEADDASSMESGRSGDAFIDAGLGFDENEVDDEAEDDDDDEDEDDEEDAPRSKRKAAPGKRRRTSGAESSEDDEDAPDDRAHQRRRMAAMEDPDEGSGEDDEDDAEDDDETRAPTRHQLEKAALAKQIAELEREALQPKSWELQGEVAATARPENSLLQAQLNYEQAVKLAPTVTVEATASLEDIIKQRIADAAWDDPAPPVSPRSQKKKGPDDLPDVSTEASKKGLAEIYASEYEAAAAAASAPAPNAAGAAAAPAKKALTPAETEVVALTAKLFAKLDALANFYFTPKPVAKEAHVSANVASIAMEEVLPLGVSDAAARAPEEVFAPAVRDGVLKSTGEMTADERAAARRARKTAKRKEQRLKEAAIAAVNRANPGLGNPHAKAKALQSVLGKSAAGTTVVLGGGRGAKRAAAAAGMASGAQASAGVSAGRVSDSTALFRQLQDEARRTIYGDAAKDKKAAAEKSKSAAAKFKL